MNLSLRCLVTIPMLCLLAGCGYVGDPLPPSLNIPVPIQDLAAVERGEDLIVQFTVPEMTTDGLVLKKYGDLDLRIGTEGLSPFHQPTWESHSQQIPIAGEVAAGQVRVTTPAKAWMGREVLFGARLSNHNGRWSGWSNFVALNVAEPLQTPTGLAAAAVAGGVRLEWNSPDDRPGLQYRVFRRVAEADRFLLAAEPGESNWLDTQTAYGASYEYRVQCVLRVGDDLAESEMTAPVQITPKDVFPPAAPKGLAAVPGLDSIELTWELAPESDVASYRVYRRQGDDAREKVADGLTNPLFSDRNVVSETQYTYTVTAVDRLGNESESSTAVTLAAP